MPRSALGLGIITVTRSAAIFLAALWNKISNNWNAETRKWNKIGA